ncbi:MAG TPA: hypothetical protein VJP86_01915, partial [Vicinamibacterales bacterium]|nr:hypothetical protein [Vicinamibacterales bacterium]
MLAGFEGHLFAEAFLERHFRPGAASDAVRRPFVQWRSRCGSLGPASSLRTLLDCGLAPFAAALGFETRDVVPGNDVLAATLCGAAAPVLAIVRRWGDPLGACWRIAAVEGGRRHAPWCILFNGSHVRLIETRHGPLSRYAEFDLDAAIDEGRTFGVMYGLLAATAFGDARHSSEVSPNSTLRAASDLFSAGVNRSLRTGVISASEAVL